MFNLLKSFNFVKYYKNNFIFFNIYFNHILWFYFRKSFFLTGKKGFYLNDEKTYIYEKKYYVQKPVNPLDLNSKNIEIKNGNIPNNAV